MVICILNKLVVVVVRRKLQKSHESVGRIIDICIFFSARLMEKYVS